MLGIKMCSEHASVMALWNGQSLYKLLILPPSFDNDFLTFSISFFFNCSEAPTGVVLLGRYSQIQFSKIRRKTPVLEPLFQ